ncbi:hypothetical protein [Microbulbifer sp. PAAF003]|uniref:hypothetical protein n=1 Tax=Microbulbifer sp. PAAF003 TaxID=3243375 RepID=UPI004039E7E4
MEYLNKDDIFELIDSLSSDVVSFDRVRPHNKGEIRKSASMDRRELKEFIAGAIEEEHQPGGDIEIFIPSINKILVGQHDGVYWLESNT